MTTVSAQGTAVSSNLADGGVGHRGGDGGVLNAHGVGRGGAIAAEDLTTVALAGSVSASVTDRTGGGDGASGVRGDGGRGEDRASGDAVSWEEGGEKNDW